MTYQYKNTDVLRASFQIDGAFALFRHTQLSGTNEYIREDFKGNVIESIVDPTISFHSFIETEVKKILDGRA